MTTRKSKIEDTVEIGFSDIRFPEKIVRRWYPNFREHFPCKEGGIPLLTLHEKT